MEIRELERKFINDIKKIVYKNISNLPKNCFVVNESSEVEDTKLSFDLYFSADIQISVRIRSFKYKNYNDITIRSKAKNGGLTEIDKLIDGKGQIYFYGVLSENEETIIKYILFDIDKIRNKLKDNGIERTNFDGTKFKFYTFNFLKENNAIINQLN
jgi:hypothetical protein